MKRMASTPRNPSSQTPQDSAAPARRAWVRPVLVEYGHLAKLTRGTSGTVSEFATKKQRTTSMCL